MPINRKRGTTWYHKVQKFRRVKPEWKFSEYRASAKRTGKVFEFSLKEFLEFVGKPCFYCGIIPPAIGLDRTDNKKGYTKENSVICCTPCNWMKRALPVDFFIEQCKKITAYQRKKKAYQKRVNQSLLRLSRVPSQASRAR